MQMKEAQILVVTALLGLAVRAGSVLAGETFVVASWLQVQCGVWDEDASITGRPGVLTGYRRCGPEDTLANMTNYGLLDVSCESQTMRITTSQSISIGKDPVVEIPGRGQVTAFMARQLKDAGMDLSGAISMRRIDIRLYNERDRKHFNGCVLHYRGKQCECGSYVYSDPPLWPNLERMIIEWPRWVLWDWLEARRQQAAAFDAGESASPEIDHVTIELTLMNNELTPGRLPGPNDKGRYVNARHLAANTMMGGVDFQGFPVLHNYEMQQYFDQAPTFIRNELNRLQAFYNRCRETGPVTPTPEAPDTAALRKAADAVQALRPFPGLWENWRFRTVAELSEATKSRQ